MSSRSNRRTIANETVRIMEEGRYTLPGGKVVNISSDLAAAVASTLIYSPEDLDELDPVDSTVAARAQIDVANQTTFAGALELLEKGAHNVCCLNFASAKNPGGGFLNGSQAQEEALARASGLYECIRAGHRYYEVNRRTSSCLYTHYLIYSPDVPVFRDDNDELLTDPWLTSIITAPAPNAGAVRRNQPEDSVLILPTLTERAKRILEIARLQGHRNLVLGAWGCGVFQNDAAEVATVFRTQLSSPRFSSAFDHIRFSVLDPKDDGTFRAFQDTFADLSGIKTNPTE